MKNLEKVRKYKHVISTVTDKYLPLYLSLRKFSLSVLYVISFTVLFQSCAPFKSTQVHDRSKILSEDIMSFNGVYENFSYMDSIQWEKQYAFWMTIKENYYLTKWLETKVKLDFINKRKVVVELLDKNGIVLKRKIVHGKLKDSYFYIRRKFMIYPFIPILYGYINRKSRFCIVDNNIHVDITKNLWIYALLAGASEKEEISFRCEKNKPLANP